MMPAWKKRWNRWRKPPPSGLPRRSGPTRSPENQFAGREAQRLVGFFEPDLCVLGTIIDHNVNHHPRPSAGTSAGAKDFLRLDDSPFSARAPVAIKIAVGIFRMLAGMLLPIRIAHPDAVGGFIIL